MVHYKYANSNTQSIELTTHTQGMLKYFYKKHFRNLSDILEVFFLHQKYLMPIYSKKCYS